ncbi:hypothetical protein, partial [Streptomyces sp. SID7804]|uniref:hypothetical protein n=1 Tax=Streptomyces sp. SID7804 TaxID=2690327 RepID=UPI001F162C15
LPGRARRPAVGGCSDVTHRIEAGAPARAPAGRSAARRPGAGFQQVRGGGVVPLVTARPQPWSAPHA